MTIWNKTKIIATVGPASSGKCELEAVLRAGADVIRVNGAHGDFSEHRRVIKLVREISGRLGLYTAILLDLPGPKYRVGKLLNEPVVLKRGQEVALLCGSPVQKGGEIPIPSNIHSAVKPGGSIFINDGIVELVVKGITGKKITCIVKAGGEVLSRKGLNLPGAKLSIPSLTAQDKKILNFAIGAGVDYIALSFVRSAKDIITLKNILRKRAPHIGVIAKIEKPEALDELDQIIAASDAIMVARGDLGIEMPFDRLPVIQKEILRKCRDAGKPSITATQMLESMVNAAKPTRAEATDVAQAVWEGSDAVMLSAETSIGRNPALAVNAMARIAREAEKDMHETGGFMDHKDPDTFQAQVLARAAAFVAGSLGVRAIVAPTRSGRTPLFISRNRPLVPVFGLAEDPKVARRMSLYWGVRPMALPKFSTVDELLRHAERAAMKSGLIKKGDSIVIASGAHGKRGGITRLVEVRRI